MINILIQILCRFFIERHPKSERQNRIKLHRERWTRSIRTFVKNSTCANVWFLLSLFIRSNRAKDRQSDVYAFSITLDQIESYRMTRREKTSRFDVQTKMKKACKSSLVPFTDSRWETTLIGKINSFSSENWTFSEQPCRKLSILLYRYEPHQR